MISRLNFFVLFLFKIFFVNNICLDPNQAEGNCSDCMPTQVLLEKRCFDKIRGCLEHSLENDTVKCRTCQNGYQFINSICQRKVTVDPLSNGQINSPAPTVIDNSEILSLDSINLITPNLTTNTSSPTNKSTTSVIIFPQVTIKRQDTGNQNILHEENLTEIIYEQYKNLSGQKFAFVSQKPLKQNYIIAISEMGSMLLLQRKQNKNYDKDRKYLKIEKEQMQERKSCSFSITYLFELRALEKALAEIRSVPGQADRISLAINYEYKRAENESILINVDITTSKIRVINQKGQMLQWEAFLNIKFNIYSKWSYYQFLHDTNLINIPTNIHKIEAQAKQRQLVYFKYFYDRQHSQYSYLKYNITENKTELLGYFVEGQNIVDIFRNASLNNDSIQKKQESAGIKDLTTFNLTKKSNIEQIEKRNKSFPNKPLLGNPQFPLSVKQEDSTSSKSIFPSASQYVDFIKNTVEFRQKFLQNYRILWVKDKVSAESNERIYEMQILTSAGTHYIQTKENTKTKKISSSFQVESYQSCAMIDNLQNDSNIIKLDTHLKKTFTALSNYQTLAAALRLEPNFEKYYFAYINEGKKKLIFEVSKKNYLNNFIVSKVQIFGNGYQFQKREFENISIKLAEGNQMNYTNKLSLKKLEPIIKDLMVAYRNYVINSTLTCSLTNQTHAKLYIGNPFATFEYTARLKGWQKGQFALLEERRSEYLLPKGFRKQRIIQIDQQDEKVKILRDSIYRRYKGYFGLGSIQVIIHKSEQHQEFDVALKTSLGFFIVRTQNIQQPNTLLTSIKKVPTTQLVLSQQKCKSSEYLDEVDLLCYKVIEGCYRQTGSICVICSDKYILSLDKRQCKTLCSWQH